MDIAATIIVYIIEYLTRSEVSTALNAYIIIAAIPTKNNIGATECCFFFSEIRNNADIKKKETMEVKKNTIVMFMYSMLSKCIVAKIEM